MAAQEFTAHGNVRAARRAIDFWYRTSRDQMSLIDFFSRCTWTEEDGQVKITYDGPAGEAPEQP